MGVTPYVPFWSISRGAENAGEWSAAKKGLSMGKVAISLGFAAIFVALGRFLFAPAFLAERADDATRILLAAGLFTIAIAAVVRK
ncbi:MAG TPA: hypothetical protein VIJ63_18495 [Roseiarcus sp.]